MKARTEDWQTKKVIPHNDRVDVLVEDEVEGEEGLRPY